MTNLMLKYKSEKFGLIFPGLKLFERLTQWKN